MKSLPGIRLNYDALIPNMRPNFTGSTSIFGKLPKRKNTYFRVMCLSWKVSWGSFAKAKRLSITCSFKRKKTVSLAFVDPSKKNHFGNTEILKFAKFRNFAQYPSCTSRRHLLFQVTRTIKTTNWVFEGTTNASEFVFFCLKLQAMLSLSPFEKLPQPTFHGRHITRK